MQSPVAQAQSGNKNLAAGQLKLLLSLGGRAYQKGGPHSLPMLAMPAGTLVLRGGQT